MTHRPRHSGGTPGAFGPPGRNYSSPKPSKGKGPSRAQQRISNPKPFVDRPVTKSVSTSDVATGKFTGGTQRATPKPKVDKTFTGGPVGMGKPPPKPKSDPKPDSDGGPVGFNFPKKKIIPEIKKKPKKDIKLTGLMKYYTMIDPSAKFAINAANRGFDKWDERNAQQHLIWSALNPWGANIHEGLDIIQQGFQVDNQDIHNNNLRQEVLKRAREIDAQKGLNTWYPSNDSIEKASFNMVTEQKENLQKGLMQDPNLPWIDTNKSMGNKTQMTPIFQYGAQASEIPLEVLEKGKKIVLEKGKKIIKNEPLFEWDFLAPKGGKGKVTIDPLNQSGGVFINWTF